METVKLVALCLALGVASPALACQCTEARDIGAAAAESDVVVIGRVTEVTRSQSLSVGTVQLENPTLTTIVPEVAWKGTPSSLQIVGGFSDCDFARFEVGQRYVVFAEYDIAGLGTREGAMWAHRCLPTQVWEGASLNALQQLGPPLLNRRISTSGNAPSPKRQSPARRTWSIVAVAVLGGAAAAMLIRIRRRRLSSR